MFTWGVISGAMAFVGGETSFYALRALLGVAEAGFFPGIIFYLTLWFPAVYRARIIGAFLAAVPLATVIGAPASGAPARVAARHVHRRAGFRGAARVRRRPGAARMAMAVPARSRAGAAALRGGPLL